MGKNNFNTVSETLMPIALNSLSDYESKGYKVKIEKNEIGFPYTPAFGATRDKTTMIVEIDEKLNFERLKSWVAYGKSSNKDIRIAVVIPEQKRSTILEDEHKLRELGIGLYSSNQQDITQLIIPRDLSLNVELPELNKLPTIIRRWLGHSYDQFIRSEWREGFESACQILEVESKKYLLSGIKSTRLNFVTTRGPRTFTKPEINKQTLGQLAGTFSLIQTKNHSDSIIEQSLSKVNKDRIGVVHHKNRNITEKRLRQNVGQHMWTIVAALKEIANAP